MSFHRRNLVLFVKEQFFVLVLILMPCIGHTQGINNLWIMGHNCGNYSYCGGSSINFLSGFPDTSHSNVQMNFLDCNANISDTSGNLLFYTNGVYIANSQNDTMVNGNDLNPSVYTNQNATRGLRVKQGNLILPMPGSTTLYYLFHETLFMDMSINDYRCSEIYYSIIDKSLDSGRGAVTQKNVVLLSDTLTIGAITACKHANGRDWWIVFHKSKGRRYYKYLFTPAGLQGPYAQDIGYSILPRDWLWQSCFSPDGNKFSSVFSKDTFDIMNFDRCTGLFSNATSIYVNDSASVRGVAFSQNSKYLYFSSSNYVYQYELLVNPISASMITISVYDKYVDRAPPFYTGFYLAQLANNGKIYILAGNDSRWMTVVNDPDSQGFSCNILQHSFLLPTYNAWTIPNFPNYFLGRESGSICDSLPFVSSHIERMKHSDLPSFPNTIVTDERGEAIQREQMNSKSCMTFRDFLENTNIKSDERHPKIEKN